MPCVTTRRSPVVEFNETFRQTARPLPRARITARSTAGANAETAWRRWATQHRVAAAMLGGLVGVHIASLLGIWFGGFSPDPLHFNTAHGVVFLPQTPPPTPFPLGALDHST